MAAPLQEERKEQSEVADGEDGEPSNGEDEEDDGDEIEEEEEEEEEGEEHQKPVSKESKTRLQKEKMENLFRRISTERVPLRVHDVVIKGNTKTKDWLIEAEVEALTNATTVQQLFQAAAIANARLHRFGIFDSVNITLDSGPPELPGTSNVIVEVVETKSPLTGDIGIFSKPEVLSPSQKFKTLGV